MSVTIDNVIFPYTSYDADGDVLYLKTGVPDNAVECDSTPEGHALRYNAEGELVGITLVSPRHWIERDGKVMVTLPHAVEVAGDALAAAVAA